MESTASVRRGLAAFAAVLPLVALAAGCGNSGHPAATADTSSTTPTTATVASTATTVTAPPHQFPEFRVAMDEATDYLDPGLSDTTEGWGVMWNVYLPLLGYQHVSGPEGAKLVPYLATHLPHISRDKRTYRLTLRKGLRYSDGTRVKATDFKKTIERDFLLDSAGAGFFRNIKGAKAFARRQKGRIRGIVADDPTRTIIIHLVAPQADFANVLVSPSWQHPFGTDDIGRDILSRVIYGSRISLSAGLALVAFALIVGLPLGLLAGYVGGTVDNLLMRAVEVILAFPTLVLALGITAILGPKLSHALLAIGLVFVPNFARLIRGQVLSVRENDFVTAARALGGNDVRVVLHHVLPNCVAPLLVQSSFAISFAILVEAALSFLGLGTQPPTPSWGIMLSQGRGYLEQAPWLGAFPGLAIFLAVLGFNLVGDGLRDALDPRLKS